MGYRSDVAIAVKKEDFIAFKTKIESDPAHMNLLLSFLTAGYSVDVMEKERDDGLWTILYYHFVRWDTDFSDIKAIEDWFRSLKEYEFARAGEEGGDITHEKEGDFEEFFSCYIENVLTVDD